MKFLFVKQTIRNCLKNKPSVINISCMGLWGILLYIINRRIKEIGIHNVNGSSVIEVLAWLNKGFSKWITIAFIIAIPIAMVHDV